MFLVGRETKKCYLYPRELCTQTKSSSSVIQDEEWHGDKKQFLPRLQMTRRVDGIGVLFCFVLTSKPPRPTDSSQKHGKLLSSCNWTYRFVLHTFLPATPFTMPLESFISKSIPRFKLWQNSHRICSSPPDNWFWPDLWQPKSILGFVFCSRSTTTEWKDIYLGTWWIIK